jgi:hypothetical protein
MGDFRIDISLAIVAAVRPQRRRPNLGTGKTKSMKRAGSIGQAFACDTCDLPPRTGAPSARCAMNVRKGSNLAARLQPRERPVSARAAAIRPTLEDRRLSTAGVHSRWLSD